MAFIDVYLILLILPFAYQQIPDSQGYPPIPYVNKIAVEPPIPDWPKYPPIPKLIPSDRFATNSERAEDGRPLWGGDMRLTDDQIDIVTNGVSKRTARKNLKSRWPGGQIPYKLDSSISVAAKTIAEGMKFWTDNTCVSFNLMPNIQNQPHLVLKHTGTGCNSWVGIYDEHTIDQTVSLDHPGCSTDYSVVAHELGHAMGLWHEQDRLDRDSYLNVYKNNMGKNRIYFETALSDVMHYDVPYEYSSIMQYTVDAFSSNDRLTLVPKDPLAEPLMGTTKQPTFNDYKIINRMYNCTANCNLNCMNGGYAASNKVKGCRCECPPGFAGDRCQTRVNVAPQCGGRITTEQTISTPDYPRNHPANTRCAWLIEAPNGKYPQITVNDFQFLYRAEHKCVWDKFRIRWNDLQSDDPGKTYCDTELVGQTITSPNRHMLITVLAQYGDYGRGFQANIRFTTQKGNGL